MQIKSDLHRTNETVHETGNYVCAAGITKSFNEGDAFPVCPKSKQETTWRHVEHEHHTGEKVTEFGSYVDKDGEHMELLEGDTFPDCPKSGQPTMWKHDGTLEVNA
ncbi:hypothetical protein Back11_21070 [Paenibacillus baekrokdamisoli]|uniref:Uncharacterized protein n=1 Tax=Paenibacillus baekrokdamisoli TaxID=1712516 RepID=A0A3G9IR52_9BACL|nr:hypothetical protein [Paenibacillus baekrokdamisoli]MBB3069884.1 hypothetical protein [Paenibacillus baekrokdamisoli]BBH20762.1 hypothetical protein Back11_21070 [Paenibacillus baekrokdamisoli]